MAKNNDISIWWTQLPPILGTPATNPISTTHHLCVGAGQNPLALAALTIFAAKADNASCCRSSCTLLEVVPLACCRYDGRCRDLSLTGLRWTLLKDHLVPAEVTRRSRCPDQPGSHQCTARAWLYCEGLRAILEREQINVVSAMLKQ
jgi:hypothetical protein